MTLDRLVKRLLSRAIRTRNGCLLIGSKDSKQRYWTVVHDGKRDYAHRAIWEYNHGPIPEGFEVCHSCDRTRCIEDSHLVLQTHAWNMADRDGKGRNGTLGEDSPLAKLTREKVLDIYMLTRTEPRFDVVAAQFSVSPQTVSRIANRTTWKHLLCPPHLTPA